MVRRLSFLSAIAAAVLLLVSARERSSNDPAFRQINSIVKTLADISGMSEIHPVPYGRISKAQLRRFLAKRIKRTLKPAEIHADELSLKMFGFVPENFDLRQSTIDLLTEQAAAFYDYDAKKLFLLDAPGEDGEEEQTTLAHELAHALADQHFNLAKYMDEAPANDDENLAHTAVVEGQASWLMLAYELKQAGRPPEPTPELLHSVTDSSDDSVTEYPVLKTSPLYIRETLLFPYTDGTLFFDEVYKKLGKRAFSAVFTDAPVDSAQIIHPDRYLSHQKPATPPLPDPDLGKTSEITEGSLGEFDHRIMIQQYIGAKAAAALAPHVRGGDFKIVEMGHIHHPILLFASQWDSPDSAAAFFADYKKIAAAKWKRCDPSRDTAVFFSGSAENGYFVCRLHGDTVSSVEGLPDRDVWDRVQADTAKH